MSSVRTLRGSVGLVAVLAIATACAGNPDAGSVGSTINPTATRTTAVESSQTSSQAAQTAASTPTAEATMSPVPFTLTSSAFDEGGAMPRAITCDGAGQSPPLRWAGVPADAKALVLVVDDPDARDFTHWTVLDLPADASGSLPEGVQGTSDAVAQGRNDFGKVGWGGPCPPSGTHHYRFTLSALSAPLGLSGYPDGDTVRAALRSAEVLGRARLTGTYHRG